LSICTFRTFHVAEPAVAAVLFAQVSRISQRSSTPEGNCAIALAVDGDVVATSTLQSFAASVTLHGVASVRKGSHTVELLYRATAGAICEFLPGKLFCIRFAILLRSLWLIWEFRCFDYCYFFAARGSVSIVQTHPRLVATNALISETLATNVATAEASGGWQDFPGQFALSVEGLVLDAPNDVVVVAQLQGIRNSRPSASVDIRVMVDNDQTAMVTLSSLPHSSLTTIHALASLEAGNHSAYLQFRSKDGNVLFGEGPVTYQRLSLIAVGRSRTAAPMRSQEVWTAPTDISGEGLTDDWRDLPHSLTTTTQLGGELTRAMLVMAHVSGIAHSGGRSSRQAVTCRFGLFVDARKVSEAEVTLCRACKPAEATLVGLVQVSPQNTHTHYRVCSFFLCIVFFGQILLKSVYFLHIF
jgi:hypothetical protein